MLNFSDDAVVDVISMGPPRKVIINQNTLELSSYYLAHLRIDWNINVYASTRGILILKDHIVSFSYI